MDISKSNIEDKRKYAVGYLLTHKNEIPQNLGIERFFSKLESYDNSIGATISALNSARQSVSELSSQLNKLSGSIDAIVGVIAESLPEEKLDEWSSKFEISEEMKKAMNIPNAKSKTVVGTVPPKIIQ